MWRVAERFEPGYGAAAAVALGLGTLVLPLSTLLFSHVFTTFLAFAAFWIMLREREGPPSPMLLGIAGLAMGYAFSSEYPTFFAALVLGGYLLSRRDAFTPGGVLRRGGAYVLGGLIGIVPLLLYNHYAFHSWTHLAYSSIPRQQQGFFGIDVPNLKVLATLLLDSRGLLTISPILALGGLGTVLLYKRGNRAEALTITAICVCYLGYNSGYYLPFGGGFMGPRFLDTLLPFLAFPVALALKRWPGPTVALAGVSIATTVIATITHPLVGYETETVVWARYLRQALFQPTIASAYGLGRGWGGIWPFLLAAGGALVLAAWATPRLRLSNRSLAIGLLVLVGWCLFAVLAPTVLGIDHAGLRIDRQSRRPHRAQHDRPPDLQLLPAEGARPDRRRLWPARAGGDATAAQRARAAPASARSRDAGRARRGLDLITRPEPATNHAPRAHRRIDDRQSGEVAAVEAAVTSEQPIGLYRGVVSDQKVRDHALARSSALAVLLPRAAGRKRSGLSDGGISHSQRRECRLSTVRISGTTTLSRPTRRRRRSDFPRQCSV